MKQRLKNSWTKIKEFHNKHLTNQILQTVVLAIFLNIVIESFGRKAIFGGIVYLFTQPLVFLLNALIIFATLSIAWLFKHRIFFYTLVSAAWLAIGITNGIILNFRMTPFTTADLGLLEAGISILPNYFTNFQIGLMIAGGVLLLVIFVLVFIFLPKREKVNYKKSIAAFLATIIIAAAGLFGSVQVGIVDTYFGNLWDAYTDYGTPYCFLNTWLNKGIRKPFGYDEAAVKGVFSEDELAKLTSKTEAGGSGDTGDSGGAGESGGTDDSSDAGDSEKDSPNIVFLQLESFIDPYEVKDLQLSGDPIPYFRELKEKYSTGYLTVPSVGGGTANTEFEIMSGMSVHFFGPGEYPYKSVLQDEICETFAYNLKDLGYSTHAMHNHRGAFYNRNTVFSHLGFDSYTSVEYMNYVSKTPRNWARDDVLTAEIIGALDSSETKDYIYAISVQGHGEYPRKKLLDNPEFVVENMEDNQGLAYAYEYYINQLKEMDDFLVNLTKTLSEYDEEVVLVLYGDHLPALDMENEDMKSGSTYDTEYVIWTNFDGFEKKDKDVKAYQLSAEIQSRLDMSEGTTTVYHQNHQDDKAYLENLKLLQYDMLYGKKYIYGGKCPFVATDIQMGYKPIKIHEIIEVADQYYISGEGFTPYSKVTIDGEVIDTIYLGSTLLKLLEDVDPDLVDEMKVSQVEKNKAILSTTE